LGLKSSSAGKLAGLSLILAAAAPAQTRAARLEPIPVAVSGTLSPFALAVEGRRVAERPGKWSALRFGDQKVAHQGGAHRPFFLSVAGSSLQPVLADEKGREEPLPTLTLPCALGVETEGEKLLVRLCEGVTSARWNGRELSLQAGRVAIEGAAVGSFVLEIGDGRLFRSYTVTIEPEPAPAPPPESPPPAARTFLTLGLPAGELAYKPFLHLYVGRHYPSRWTLQGLVELSLPSYGVIPRFALGVLAGYQLWRLTDRVPIEVGIEVRAVLKSLYLSEIAPTQGGALGALPPARMGVLAGPYLKVEPLAWGPLRFGASFELAPLETNSVGGGTLIQILISYTW
jgi:hypothetical protein